MVFRSEASTSGETSRLRASAVYHTRWAPEHDAGPYWLKSQSATSESKSPLERLLHVTRGSAISGKKLA